MNILDRETSPYLLQHKDNPVYWQPWSEDAFLTAKRQDKPVILSIGYSTCHWCHVMESESFEDQATADIMNRHFVCIKVDREERPDIDEFYMNVCQVINGSGGWPLNCFLLPDKRPFFAGTYYPPSPAHGRPSWIQVMTHLLDYYKNKPLEVEAQAVQIMGIIDQTDQKVESAISNISEESFSFDPMFAKLHSVYDHLNGGFKGAPKFPQAASYDLLLNRYLLGHSETELIHVKRTLASMAHGGMYDLLHGGFARYTVDAAWRVPHFEKMLYDNAWLIGLYAKAYSVTGELWMKNICIHTIDFLTATMYSKAGTFVAAIDADSEGKEGTYYVWSGTDLDLLSSQAQEALYANLDIFQTGNWEETNVLIFQDLDKMRTHYENLFLDISALKLALDEMKLFASKRPFPHIDNKIIFSWNAYMGLALSTAGICLKEPRFINQSVALLENLLQQNTADGLLIHTSVGGRQARHGFAEDYAALIPWLLHLSQSTSSTEYIKLAENWMAKAETLFRDENKGLFYTTSTIQQDILTRNFETYDSASPSPNSLMLKSYMELYLLTKSNEYLEKYEKIADYFKHESLKHPQAHMYAMSIIYQFEQSNEIILITGNMARQWSESLKFILSPGVLMRIVDSIQDLNKLNIESHPEKTLIYRCKNFNCQLPLENIDAFIKTL